MSEKPSILFACKANAGRSVTGKMLAEHYAGDRADVFSAGSEPGDHVRATWKFCSVSMAVEIVPKTNVHPFASGFLRLGPPPSAGGT